MDNLYEAYLDVYQELDEAKGEGPEAATPGTQLFQQVFRGAKKVKGSKETRMDTAAFQGKGSKAKRRMNSEQVDIYDVILSHLLDEGFASTEESAIAIMANMSEDWRNEILDEETRRTEYLQKKFDKENKAKSGSAHIAIPGKQNTGQALYKARQSERHMRGEK